MHLTAGQRVSVPVEFMCGMAGERGAESSQMLIPPFVELQLKDKIILILPVEHEMIIIAVLATLDWGFLTFLTLFVTVYTK